MAGNARAVPLTALEAKPGKETRFSCPGSTGSEYVYFEKVIYKNVAIVFKISSRNLLFATPSTGHNHSEALSVLLGATLFGPESSTVSVGTLSTSSN